MLAMLILQTNRDCWRQMISNNLFEVLYEQKEGLENCLQFQRQ